MCFFAVWSRSKSLFILLTVFKCKHIFIWHFKKIWRYTVDAAHFLRREIVHILKISTLSHSALECFAAFHILLCILYQTVFISGSLFTQTFGLPCVAADSNLKKKISSWTSYANVSEKYCNIKNNLNDSSINVQPID